MTLDVFYNGYGQRKHVGRLTSDRQRILFEYSADFLDSGIELSPFMLPLSSGVFEDTKRTFDGLFGLFNDSLPDGWGCLLLDRQLRKHGKTYQQITPLDRLSLISKNPMGALEYEPAISEEITGNGIELDSLSCEVSKILKGEASLLLDELVEMNGSSGGARPKIVALVSDDRQNIIHSGDALPEGHSHWLIKFPASTDAPNIGAIEYAYSLMAARAGVEMPETHLFESKTCAGFFGVKRFDRIGGQKLHMHTACGLLHASHRYSSVDYETLIKLTLNLTRSEREAEKLVRLMIFNVKTGNKDDHSKNFSFLLSPENEWKLAPAYDLTPSEGINGEHATMVNGKGTGITDNDLIETAQLSGLPESRIREIIEQTEDAFAWYKTIKKDSSRISVENPSP